MHSYVFRITAFVVALAVCLGGCQSGTKAPKPTPGGKVAADKDHDHDHDQDHSFLFHDANENYHLRVEFDAAKKEAKVKVLDDAVKEEVRLTADALTLDIKNGKPHRVMLKADRPEGKKDTAIFRGTDDRFGEKIDPAKIEISVDIQKKNYVFTLDKDHAKKK